MLVSECNQASAKLRTETEGFKQDIKHFRETNEQITLAAEKSLTDCDSNEKLAVELNGETKTALGNAENIRDQSAQLVDIARETRKKQGEYITYMNDTASSMEKMRATAQDTEESIVSLRAARAGEHGRGFAVVVACASFLLVCEYGEGTSNPEIVIFKRR